jgi:hypothetical protein
VILARRNSMWAVGAGIAIAVFWNGLNLFVTRNIQMGAVELWSFLRVLIIAGVAALLDRRIADKKLWKVAAGGVVVLAYMALIVVVAAPR